MKKNIAYYLEDTSRLSKVDIKDLNDWLAEMPYSQPLRLLAKIKEEQVGILSSESVQVYGAHYAEDYEQIAKHDSKNAKAETTKTVVKTQKDNISLVDVVEESAATVPEILHNLANDAAEDNVESSVLETDPNIELVNEVYHSAADEVMEDIVENEVLEQFEEVEEVIEIEKTDKVVEAPEESIEEIVEEVVKTEEEISGNVKYEDHTSNINIQDSKKKEIKEVAALDGKTGKYTGAIESENLGIIVGAIPFSMTNLQLPPDKKTKKKKSKKKDKTSKAKKTKSTKSKIKSKKAKSTAKKNKKSAEIKKVKSADLKPKDKKTKKKKSKKSKVSEVSKVSKVKKIKGSIVETPQVKLKAKKAKPSKKNRKKKVKYLVVNNNTDRDFKLDDFDGVSNYANWLLKKEPVNGNAMGKKDKKKGKKKKKKSKVLKIAADSVKKSELIISEPLADIMAAQGHRKKAKKMYSQLSLIFPEKSSYFAAKIENLKKK